MKYFIIWVLTSMIGSICIIMFVEPTNENSKLGTFAVTSLITGTACLAAMVIDREKKEK